MFGYFYHRTLEKVAQAFGTLFNNIYVVKYDSTNTEESRILVPINYANRHSYIARLAAQPQLEEGIYVEQIFPRLAFTEHEPVYDSSRKLNTIHRDFSDVTEDGIKASAYRSVPYNMTYTLTIIAKHKVEANQILEQILPYFTPAYTIKIDAIEGMDYEENIPVELMGIAFSDNFEQEMEGAAREIRYDLTFLAKIQFHGPIENANIIKHVQVDVYTPPTLDDETILSVPRKARETLETDPPDADPGDIFGYNETWEEFNDNSRYNPITDQDEPLDD